MLVDSHCHLDFPDFGDDLDGVLARAHEAGVGTLLTICTHVTRFEQVLALAEAHDHIYCTVGIHPHEAGREPEVDAEKLVTLAKHPKVVGFGETGLDYYYEHSPREAQQKGFRTHIAAARAAGLPVVVHTRDAEDDTVRILTEEREKGAFKGVIHCFSGSRALADQVLALGLYISVSGIVTFKKADALREVVAAVPLDKLLVETDAPYLAPVPRRGKRNEPAFTAYTAAQVAELKRVDAAALAAATTDNFFRLFGKARGPGNSCD
jgi:TatD DNase family protein